MLNSAFEGRSRSFCQEFLAAPAARRYILGRGEYAASIARVVPVRGFVDDFARDETFMDLPVVRSHALPSGSLVVVASMLRPTSALKKLDDSNVSALDYFAFERFSGLPLKPVTFWNEFRADYARNHDRYEAVRHRLADDASRDLFDAIVRFRLTGDVSAMAGTRYDMVNQYFEDFLNLAPSGESFVDVGCFDGFTSLEFARRAPDFAHITAFEPATENFEVVVKNLEPLGSARVTVHECGLSDASAVLSFTDGQGSSSRLSQHGHSRIRVERLDDMGIVSATFLKMDVEGAEEPALTGSIETIRRFRPRLAISAYHRAQDFWRIPEVVDATGVQYEIRMRHYTEGIDETVMFFLPVGGPG